VYAIPVLVDPLVFYWNRDLFTNEAIAQVPKDWDTFVKLVPRLSHIENGAKLTQSAVSFGEYDNVLHAKEILSALLMQTGVSMVSESDDNFVSDFAISYNSNLNPNLALKFYTSFSNPIKTVYSWNKTFDRSLEEFAANKIAMYPGFVSEKKNTGRN
jgi:ABC-type glycerol-3-phosphate transport system substrate-binding protein